MAFFAPIHEPANFLKSRFSNHLLKLLVSVRPDDQCNFIDQIASFKTIKRVDNDRLPAERHSQLVEAHSLAAACSYNDSGGHGECECECGCKYLLTLAPTLTLISSKCFLDSLTQGFSIDATRSSFGR